MSLFPLFVKLEARKCVVVGAGKIATGKARELLRGGAQVVVVAPEATAWVKAQAQGGRLAWMRREFVRSDVKDALLVVAATDSAATNEAVFRTCSERRVLCNVVDDPVHCDFFYPAVVRRGALQIAVSTGGRSPSLARRLRIKLSKEFGHEYRGWVEYVGKKRKEILEQCSGGSKRRKLIDEIASEESLERWRSGHRADARRGRVSAHHKRETAPKSKT